jgi:hypothetical protein
MLRYEKDDYAQDHVDDDAVNASCVASWRCRSDAEGRAETLFVDFHNSWVFDSRRWCGRADATDRLLRALELNRLGRRHVG